MKKLEVIVDGDKIRQVCEALLSSNATDMTVTDCGNPGATLSYVRSFRTENLVPDLMPRYQIEVIVPSDQVAFVVDVISRNGGLGANCTDRLKVSSIDTAIRIRNGDRGEDALG